MSKTIKKSIRINAEIISLVDAYREQSKSGFSEALEILLIKGLENVNAIQSLKQLIKDEMKNTREEVKNQGNRLAGININHFKFTGMIYSHSFNLFKNASNFSKDEINQVEKLGISKSLELLKQKSQGDEQ